MRYLKEYNQYNEYYYSIDIDAICKRYDIKNYTINSDGSIDVDGSVYLNEMDLNKLPLKFNRVSGTFYCYRNLLTSLEGAPKWVGGNFYCFDNQLTSLEGAPEEVGGYFNCKHNQLTSLVGAPKWVGDFSCRNNPLPDLIINNLKDIKYILKWQDDYSIWKPDGSLDEYKFKQMMKDK